MILERHQVKSGLLGQLRERDHAAPDSRRPG